jgi:hypothetical protein
MALREVKGGFVGELSAMRKLQKRPCETTGFANQSSAPEYNIALASSSYRVPNCWCLTIRHAVRRKSIASTLAAASSCVCGST